MEKLLKLFQESKYEELLEQLNNLDESAKNYYNMIVLKIRVLIKLTRLEEAAKLIETELSMPYIPGDFEKTFKELKLDIISLKPEDNKIVVVSEQELEEVLFRSEDDLKTLNLIGKIAKLNIKPYLEILSKYLIWESGKNNIKSMIMYTFKNSNIAGEFEVLKKGITYKFVPAELTNTNELKSFKIAQEIIDKSFFQEVSKQDLAAHLVFRRLFEQCPADVSNTEAKNMALNIIKEVTDSFA